MARWGVREIGISIICVNSMILPAMFRPAFWKSDKALARMRQKKRPSLYFFRTLREWASARRHRPQGFRRTIGDSVLRWSSNFSPQNSNQSAKKVGRPSGSGESESEKGHATMGLTQKNAGGPSWDLEKGPTTRHGPEQREHLHEHSDECDEEKLRRENAELRREVEALRREAGQSAEGKDGTVMVSQMVQVESSMHQNGDT
ncbi:unnamed protein product [Discula destructiva]